MSPAPAAFATPLVSPAPIVTPVAPPPAPPIPSNLAVPQIVSLAHNAGTFKQQMPQVLAELLKQGKINQEWLAAVKMECKVQEIWEMSDDQKNELFEILCNYNLITRMP